MHGPSCCVPAFAFRVSRLYDFHLPRDGELTHKHDPEQFKRVLTRHIDDAARPVRLTV